MYARYSISLLQNTKEKTTLPSDSIPISTKIPSTLHIRPEFTYHN